jgi:peptidoglycan/LPS O-acetylase OafA/YrhL
MALTLKFAFYFGNVIENGKEVTKEVNSSSNIINLLLAITFVAGSVVAIFLYKNRKQQILVTAILIAIGIINIFLLWNGTKAFVKGTYGLAAVLPVFAVGFAISALRGIWADKKKIDELHSSRMR